MNPVVVSIGHNVQMSLVFLDQNGNPMRTSPAPDAPPVWTQSDPVIGALTAGSSGLTATEAALAAGVDTVSVSLTVGGVQFSASIPIDVSPAAQVLTSVQIAAAVE